MLVSKSLPIRYRLSITMALAIIIVSICLLLIGQHLYDQRDQDFQKTYISSQKNLWNAISINEKSEMASNFKTFSRNRKLTTALYRKNFSNLRELLGPTATRFKAMGISDNLVIVSTEGLVVFSEIKEVTQAPKIAERVLKSLNQISDIELTSDGRLVHVVAFPILDRADPVGVGILEKSLASSVNKIKEANQYDVIVYDKNNKNQATTLENGITLDFTDVPDDGKYWETELNNKIMGIASVPLTNAEGQRVAIINTLEEITSQVNTRQQTWLGTAVLIVILLIITTVGMYWYMHKTLKPLNKAVNYIERVAEGDLSVEIDCDRSDEFGRLLEAMKKMNNGLRNLVSQVSSAVQEVTNTIGHVKNASEQTEQRVLKQHSSLQELSSSIEQMATNAQDVTGNISQLERSAEQSKESTHQSDILVKESVQQVSTLTNSLQSGGQTMRDLEEKSNQIEVVLEVIKNIAEQTNLLALNAAIEAARAGETGRGFAVVADEVRSLAARTQDSTIEIEEIIKAVQSGVNHAVKIMEESIQYASQVSEQSVNISNALDSVNGQITNISGLSTQVSGASENQLTATENMNQSITTISEMADATAEHSRVFAENVSQLMKLSGQLEREMGHFRLHDDDG